MTKVITDYLHIPYQCVYNVPLQCVYYGKDRFRERCKRIKISEGFNI